MRSALFWCGGVILMHHLQAEKEHIKYSFSLVRESVHAREYLYEIRVDGKNYKCRYTMNSNTRLKGSFFVEGNGWRSSVYNIEKLYDFIRISETSINYHDIYFLGKDSIVDIYMKNGIKHAISTISITTQKSTFTITPTTLVMERDRMEYSTKSILHLFIMSGAIDKVKFVANDVVCYVGSSLSLLAYSDGQTQVIGVVTTNVKNGNETLQSINSFFNQRYDVIRTGSFTYKVNEYVEGMTTSFLKRTMNLEIGDDTIFDTDSRTTYTYTIDNGYITFRKQ